MNYGIIFDCDGTIVDSLGFVMESFHYALNKVGEEPRSDAEVKRYFGSAADRIFLNLIKDSKKSLDAFEYFLEHQTKLALKTELHKGISDLLDILEENKIPMAIVTGRHARDLEIVINRHKISHRFVTLIADNELSKPKPAPEGILLAAKRMGLMPSQTFYVGDSVVDIQAARAAGSNGIAALWDDLANIDELNHEEPVFLAHKPMDIWNHINRGT